MNAADSLQLISIVIAINALMMALFLWAVNTDKKNIKKNMKEIERHSNHMDKVTSELIEWMIAKETLDKNERGMIRRMLKSSGHSEEIKRFDVATTPIRLECKKNLQHLMLFSTNDARRRSAHKQLSNAYGDADTLSLIRELKSIFPRDKQLIYAMKELENRINSTIKDRYNKKRQADA